MQYANWLIVRCMTTHEQKVAYAIYAAELVIGIYEKKYPGNLASRKAIEAAKAYLANPCEKTRKAAAYAAYAADDADAAAYAAAAAAAYAAAAAAYAAAAAAAKEEQCNYIRMHLEFASILENITNK